MLAGAFRACKTARHAAPLLRDKLYTLINVAGLALAVASSVVLGIYLRGELTYDRHNVNHERTCVSFPRART